MSSCACPRIFLRGCWLEGLEGGRLSRKRTGTGQVARRVPSVRGGEKSRSNPRATIFRSRNKPQTLSRDCTLCLVIALYGRVSMGAKGHNRPDARSGRVSGWRTCGGGAEFDVSDAASGNRAFGGARRRVRAARRRASARAGDGARAAARTCCPAATGTNIVRLEVTPAPCAAPG